MKTDEEIDDLIGELDSIARNYDHWEYGLPTDDENMVKLRQAIRQWMEQKP